MASNASNGGVALALIINNSYKQYKNSPYITIIAVALELGGCVDHSGLVLRLLQCLDDKDVKTSLLFFTNKTARKIWMLHILLVTGMIKLQNKGYCSGNNYGGSIYMEGHDMEPPY